MKVRYLVLPMIFVGVLSAQPGHGMRGSLTPPTPEQVVDREVTFLTRYFSLTPAQATDVKGVLTTEQTCLASSSTNLKTVREGLVTAIKTPSGDVATAISNLSAVQVAQETCRAKAAAAIYADLQPGQQAKVGDGLGPLMGGGGGGPHFGPHPGGPPPAH